MRRIVITGATSFIGVNLIQAFLQDDLYRIYAVVRGKSPKLVRLPIDARIKIINADMLEYDKLAEQISDRVYGFIHLAWSGTREQSRNDAALQEKNYNCSIKALVSAAALKAQVFMTAGSQAEYGPVLGTVLENTIARPQSEYGQFKLRFYEAAKEKCKDNNIKFYEPRFFSLYGPGDYEKALVISMLKKMLNNEPCDLTDCTQLWNFLHVRDAAAGIKHLIDNLQYQDGIYNFGSTITKPLKDYVQSMKLISDSKSKLNFGAIPHNDNGKIGLNPCIDKLLSTGWHEHILFSEGIKEIVAQLKGGRPKMP